MTQELRTAILALRVRVLFGLAQRLGFTTSEAEVSRLAAVMPDGAVVSELKRARATQSWWRNLLGFGSK